MHVYVPCSKLLIHSADVSLHQRLLTGGDFAPEGAPGSVAFTFVGWGWGYSWPPVGRDQKGC